MQLLCFATEQQWQQQVLAGWGAHPSSQGSNAFITAAVCFCAAMTFWFGQDMTTACWSTTASPSIHIQQEHDHAQHLPVACRPSQPSLHRQAVMFCAPACSAAHEQGNRQVKMLRLSAAHHHHAIELRCLISGAQIYIVELLVHKAIGWED